MSYFIYLISTYLLVHIRSVDVFWYICIQQQWTNQALNSLKEAVSVLFSVALSSSSVPCGAEVMLLFAGKVIATSNHRAKTILVYFTLHSLIIKPVPVSAEQRDVVAAVWFCNYLHIWWQINTNWKLGNCATHCLYITNIPSFLPQTYTHLIMSLENMNIIL